MKTVAIKIIPKPTNLAHRLIIKRQIETLNNCNNQYIVPLLDVFESSENYYIVMPLYEKGDLYNLKQSKESVNEQLAANLINQILNSLQYLHEEQCIIHRYY